MASISVPFRFTNGKVASVSNTSTVAKQKITDVLATKPFERVTRHNYGAGMHNLLFEHLDELVFSDFKVDAIQTIHENVSRVSVMDMAVSTTEPSEYGDGDTTATISVYFKTPLSAPQVVKYVVVTDGSLTEETPI